MQDDFRDSLPSDAENYDVFCERCQKVHKFYAMTREQYDQIIRDAAQKLADAIDAQIADEIMRELGHP